MCFILYHSIFFNANHKNEKPIFAFLLKHLFIIGIAMIDIHIKNSAGILQKVDQITEGCWINIYPPFVNEELVALSSKLDIPQDFLTDSLDINERSRYERDDHVDLIVINTPVANTDEVSVVDDRDALFVTIPIGVIKKSGFILTISRYQNDVIDDLLNGKLKGLDPADHGKFILQLFDRNVFYFLHYLQSINTLRNSFEQELYHSSRNKELSKLLNIQKSLVYFVTTLRSNELVKMKMKRTDFLQIANDEYKTDLLEEVLIDNSQALEMAEVYTNILNGTMDAFAAIISNNVNTVMRRLTAITIVLMVPTLVASFYGMNVQLPFEDRTWAFYAVVGVSVVISSVVVGFFMRKRLF